MPFGAVQIGGYSMNNDYYIIHKKRSVLRFIFETTILITFWMYIITDALIITSVLFNIRIPIIDSFIYYLAIDYGDAKHLIHLTSIVILVCIVVALCCVIKRYGERYF